MFSCSFTTQLHNVIHDTSVYTYVIHYLKIQNILSSPEAPLGPFVPHTHPKYPWIYYFRLVLPVWEFIREIIKYILLFLTSFCWVSIMLLILICVPACISSLFVFIAVNSISLCEYTTILLHIYLLIDVCIICSFGLLWIKLLCVSFCVPLSSFLWINDS